MKKGLHFYMHSKRNKIFLLLFLVVGIGVSFFLVPQQRSFESYVGRAEEYLQKKKFNRAIKSYLRASKAYPKHERIPEVLLAVGDVYNFSLSDSAKAGEAYRMLSERYPRSFETRRALQNAAEMYEKNEQYTQVLENYRKIIQNFPRAGDLDQIRFKIAMTEFKLKKFSEAKTTLMEIIEKNPESEISDQVLYQLGNIYFTEGNSREAIQVLETGLQKFPQSTLNLEMLFTLANAYEEIGEFDKALKFYEVLKKSYSNPKLIEKKLENLLERIKERDKINSLKKSAVGH